MEEQEKESWLDNDWVAVLALGLTALGVAAFGIDRVWTYLTGNGLPQGVEFTWNCAVPAILLSTLVLTGVCLVIRSD